MPEVDPSLATEFALASLVVPVLGLGAYRLGAVDITGYVAGLFAGITVFWLGGWTWFVLVFYLTTVGSIFTRLGFSRKAGLGVAQEKGGRRGWRNVTANLLVGGVAALLFRYTGVGLWYAFFLGAVNSMASDTLATEIGLTSTERPRLITRLRERVEAGTSGAVTWRGAYATLGAAIGGGVIGTMGGSALGWSFPLAIAVAVVGGVSGTFFDSIIGATLQGRYKCRECGKETERGTHCGSPAEILRGSRFMDNDMVNVVSSLLGGSVAAGAFLLL